MIDPHDGKSIGIRPPRTRADIILITHDHYDHNASRVVKGEHAEVKAAEGELDIRGMTINAFKTYHDEVQGHKRGENSIYCFEMDGIRFCHLGDLGHTLEDDLISEMGNIDILFIPIGGVTTINAEQAKAIIARIAPRIVVPMHYRISGLGLVLDNLENFLKDIPEDLIYRVGNEIDFIHDDMVEDMEYWVFSM